MNITMILEMAASAGDQAVVTASDRSLSAGELLDLAHAAAGRFRGHPSVLYLGGNHAGYPVALLGPAMAAAPCVPLTSGRGARHWGAREARPRGVFVRRPGAFDALLAPPDRAPDTPSTLDDDAVAALIYTSGTTAEPKAA